MADLDELQNTFSGRKPSLDARGRVRGFRTRPGAPLADTQRGLTTGSNATSAVDWVGRFKNTGQQMQNAARSELGLDPESAASAMAGAERPAVETAPFAVMPTGGGIAAQTLDSAFGPGYWNKLVGRGQWSTPPPMQTTTGTQGIARNITGLPAGQYATASFVPGQNSAASLAKRKTPPVWNNPWARNG